MEARYERSYRVEAAIGSINLGIDFELFSSPEEAIEYLEGYQMAGFDEPIHLTSKMRKVLIKAW
ncbi:MAG: hypothetical protein AABX75_01445 [Nanoarchaeota archaeon]